MKQEPTQKSIKKNTFFNFLLTFASILFPLITTPYISRVLNIEDIGIINQGSVFSALFINLISLGLAGYGAREIARVRDDRKKLSRVFFSVITLLIAAFIIGSVFYLGFTVLFVADQKLRQVYLIYFFIVAANPFMIEWLYTGLEEFKYISLRSICIKILMFLLFFVFIRESKDFLRYALLLVGAQSLNSIFNIIHARKYVSFHFFKLDLKTVFFGAKYFYLQTLVAVCYQNINQLVLGNNDKVQLALYVRATTLAAVISSCVTPIMNAVKPRLEHIIVADRRQYEFYIEKCFSCVMIVLVPLCFGMAVLSSKIILLFGGEQFSSGGGVLRIVAFSTLISVLSVFFNSIISTPAGFERNTFFGNISVAAFSLILNPVLVLKLGANGAAFAMLLAESSGLIVQLIFIRKQNLYLKFITWRNLKYFVAAGAMYFLVWILSKMITRTFVSVCVCVVFGVVCYAVIYLACVFLFKDKNDIVVSALHRILAGGKK